MVQQVIMDMITYFKRDAIRINHALKVYTFAKTIGELENLDKDDQFILELAAVLHDIGIKVSEEKYNSSAGKYQEIEGPGVAANILEKFNLNEKHLKRILYLIGNHHSYSKIDHLDFQILVEADFLVNIFEDSMKRDAIEIVKSKYFKTVTGMQFLESMYL